MSGKTSIEWTDSVWNPVVGCTQVSAGCDHCYALTLHQKRHEAWKGGTFPTAPPQYHHPFSVVQTIPERLEDPLRWRQPRMIFVNSVSDLFHADVPTEYVDRVFGVMAGARRHIFQVLTKRPQRMARYLNDPETKTRVWHAGRAVASRSASRPVRWQDWYDVLPVARPGQGPDWCYPAEWPLPNVWLGTSVENQDAAYRLDFLARTPAAVRFVSAEPLLGPIGFHRWIPALDWIITGGESGPGHRPVDPDWVRSIRDQCLDAGVAFFHKQWGGHTPKAGGRELDGRTWDEMPAAAPGRGRGR